MEDQDFLMHYGVLGMKWGVRRARKYESKAKKARSAKNTEKAAKYSSKAKKIRSYHERMSGGKKVLDRVEKQSLGKSLVQSYVFSTYGAVKYNEARASGRSRSSAALDGFVNGFINRATSGIYGVAAPRIDHAKDKK